MIIRYDMKKLPDGQWCVYDIITGGVAKHNGKNLVGLNIIETDTMADLLNQLHAKGPAKTLH